MGSLLISRSLRSVVGCILVMLSGCVQLGPSILQSNRTNYNIAVHESANEELLLNIARLRYREPVQFLQLSSITANFNVTTDLSFSGVFPEGLLNTYSMIFGMAYSENPTLSYIPLDGSAFASNFLKETNHDTILLLIRGGWNIKRVMRFLVRQIGDLSNFPGESPSYANFIELIELWSTLQSRGDLAFVNIPVETTVISKGIPATEVDWSKRMLADQAGYSFQPGKDGQYQLVKSGSSKLVLQLIYSSTAEADKTDQLLGIKAKRHFISKQRIVTRIQLIDPSETHELIESDLETPKVPIRLRSFGNLLYYAARGVEVPKEHQNVIKIYRDLLGKPFDAHQPLKNLLNIQSSRDRPEHAFLSVYYRDHWFYIDDRNWVSKDSFNFLTLILSLQSEGEKVAPVLTIPAS